MSNERLQKIRESSRKARTPVNRRVDNSTADIVNVRVREALKNLESVPQMRPILDSIKNSDVTFRYDASLADDGTNALYDNDKKEIIFTQQILKIKNPEDYLRFIRAVAHECCHADQDKNGLISDRIKNPSFKDVFRINKMMEIEAKLLETIVENEFLKKDEFKNVEPSIACAFYQSCLEKCDNDVSKANTRFVASYWAGAVTNWRDNYTIQALEAAETEDSKKIDKYADFKKFYKSMLFKSSSKFTEYTKKSALEIAQIFVERMSINISAEALLKGGFDFTKFDDQKNALIVSLPFEGESYTISYNNADKDFYPTKFFDKENKEIEKGFIDRQTWEYISEEEAEKQSQLEQTQQGKEKELKAKRGLKIHGIPNLLLGGKARR